MGKNKQLRGSYRQRKQFKKAKIRGKKVLGPGKTWTTLKKGNK
jgi:hypothetical protein